jgi:hypothetical protein
MLREAIHSFTASMRSSRIAASRSMAATIDLIVLIM